MKNLKKRRNISFWLPLFSPIYTYILLLFWLTSTWGSRCSLFLKDIPLMMIFQEKIKIPEVRSFGILYSKTWCEYLDKFFLWYSMLQFPVFFHTILCANWGSSFAFQDICKKLTNGVMQWCSFITFAICVSSQLNLPQTLWQT